MPTQPLSAAQWWSDELVKAAVQLIWREKKGSAMWV